MRDVILAILSDKENRNPRLLTPSRLEHEASVASPQSRLKANGFRVQRLGTEIRCQALAWVNGDT